MSKYMCRYSLQPKMNNFKYVTLLQLTVVLSCLSGSFLLIQCKIWFRNYYISEDMIEGLSGVNR